MDTEPVPAPGLTEEQVETLTDLMVAKLALVAVQNRNDPDHEEWLKDIRPVNRDEVRLVIIDTDILVRAADVDAELEWWASGKPERP